MPPVISLILHVFRYMRLSVFLGLLIRFSSWPALVICAVGLFQMSKLSQFIFIASIVIHFHCFSEHRDAFNILKI